MGSQGDVNDAFYLYHSFPREGDDSQAIQVLKSILEYGLLATPEILMWMFGDGETFHVAQKRICFTALKEYELEEHSKVFGELSIGVARADMESIGAVPVFYVPRALHDERQGRNIGGFHMERLYQLMVITHHLQKKDENIPFRNKRIDLQDIDAFVRYLTGLFCPIEDVDSDKERFYYAQKEWRVMGNLFYKGKALSRKLSKDEVRLFESISPNFFNTVNEFPTGRYRNIEQSLLIPTIGDEPVRQKIAKVVTPERLSNEVINILEEFDISPEVIIL